jgi:hypothetical protein
MGSAMEVERGAGAGESSEGHMFLRRNSCLGPVFLKNAHVSLESLTSIEAALATLALRDARLKNTPLCRP